MEVEEIPKEAINKIICEYNSFQFTKTACKKILGNMNDVTDLYMHHIYSQDGLKNCNLGKIIMRINRVPQRRLNWDYAINSLRNSIGLEPTKYDFIL